MILVIGGSGLLGKELCRELRSRKWRYLSPDRVELDICDDLSVHRFMHKNRPPIVINLAAMTNVDDCEGRPNLANLVNGEAVGRLARSCSKFGSKFIQISTDYVFDGTRSSPYIETDITAPLNQYGASKLLGEQYAIVNGGIVLRVQWLFGLFRANFVDYVVNAALNGSKMNVLTNQFSSPTSAKWLSYMVCDIAHKVKTPGIYHLTHDDYVSRYDCAKYIVEGLGANVDCLVPTDDIRGWVAKRPLYTVMDNRKIKITMGVKGMGTWETDIREYISAKYRRGIYGR